MKRIKLHNVLVLVVIFLFVNLPIVTALEISNVQATDITQNSAAITWTTDQPADSFVHYGPDVNTLQTIGDAAAVSSHHLPLTNLMPQTTYHFSVESNDVLNNNSNSLYSFTTPAPDTEAPALAVELPVSIKGDHLTITGTTEASAVISLWINDRPDGSVIANADRNFQFTNVAIAANELSAIKVTARDAAGNEAIFTGSVRSDNLPPQITLRPIQNLTTQNSLMLNGTVSENSTIVITVNDRSAATTTGLKFNQEVQLKEGKNILKITAMDAAGWESVVQQDVESDTRAPSVRFDLVSGTEYYEGRADTKINGETEAGAVVFLYIFLQGVDNYRPDLKRAIAKVTAGDDGNFTFNDVSFPPPIFTSLKELAPREVPPGLEEILMGNIGQLGQEQRKAYRVVIIAEDKTGKTGYADKTVNVNSCYSGNAAFDVSPSAEFPPTPFRLDPGLMEDGRQSIEAVFETKYRGTSIESINPTTGQPEPGFRISNVQFQKACTRQTGEEEDYKYGCQLLPAQMKVQSNQDQTAHYITANLHAASDFIETDKDPWKDFVKKRQLKMPLKIVINYQEKEVNGAWSQTKSQVACYDLGYFVDIPIKSQDMVPDFLANEGIDALNWTIQQIENVKPYFETALLVSGVSCVGSFLTKTVVRLYRIFMSNYEPWLTKGKGDDKKCPLGKEQQKLLLKETIDNWKELKASRTNLPPESQIPSSIGTNEEAKYSLTERCPKTAAAWELESNVDKLYRFTCDRFLCRPVPARWTENADENEVQDVVDAQTQCAGTALGMPLTPVENCRERLEESPVNNRVIQRQNTDQQPLKCFENHGVLYYAPGGSTEQPYENQRIWRLSPATSVISPGQSSLQTLLAYQPPGSDNFIIGTDQTCPQLCERKPGYEAVKDGHSISSLNALGEVLTPAATATEGACYKQNPDGSLTGNNGATIRGTKIKGGYTRDCFIDYNHPDRGLYQCVCDKKRPTETTLPSPSPWREVRTATKKVGTSAEEWFYREDRVYAESGKTIGTNYPSWRYYEGRDFSGGFGLNSGLDNFKDNTKPAEMSNTKIDPHKDTLDTFQSVCLRGIWARLNMLESTLIGMRNCIEQAKYTGLHDAGMCKTLFTQYVCGLIYKGISYLANSCSPLSLRDQGSSDHTQDSNDIAQFFKAGFNAIPQALDTSIQEVKSDYGDANFQQFFSTGSQGFAESMCLAAFGYDFPLGMDFIRDTAYSFSTEVTAMFPIAERELSTYDPVKGTAVYNYNLGGVMFPGCKIRGYKTTLKCIGPEDVGNPDVDRTCGGKGCDCLQATGARPELQGEHTYSVDKGSSFNGVTKGQMFDFPIPSPQKVSSNFRYDHVVLEVFLDPSEKVDSCIDKGRQTANGGIFYYPIQDITPEVSINCFADPVSGKFTCPKVKDIFGGGQTYLEHPFVQCYDKRKDEFVNCDSANALIEGDALVIQPFLNLGGDEPACLQITDNRGFINQPAIQLPENQQGSYSPRLTLTTITSQMIQGGGAGTVITNPGSDPGCGGNNGQVNVLATPSSGGTARALRFTYAQQPSGKYQLTIPAGVTVEQIDGYTLNGPVLTKNGVIDLTPTEIDAASFMVDGFKMSKIFGNPRPQNPVQGQCTYDLRPSQLTGSSSNLGSLQLTLKVLKPGPNEHCFDTTTLMPRSSYGEVTITKPIRLQVQLQEVAAASDMHHDFISGNYDVVMAKAEAVFRREESTLNSAIAIYYWIASAIAKGNGVTQNSLQIQSLLDLFFLRKFSTSVILDAYPSDVTSTTEYKKINTYLCCVDKKLLSPSNYPACAGVNCASGTTCGFNDVLPTFAKPADWNLYTCKTPAAGQTCYRQNVYSDQNIAQTNNLIFGCPGAELCCPP